MDIQFWYHIVILLSTQLQIVYNQHLFNNIVVMDKKQNQIELHLSAQIQNLCQFVDKKLDDSTRQLCPELCEYTSEAQRLHWIKQVFMALSSSKSNLEELMTSRQDTDCSQYQQSLQKLQSEIRHHIAIQAEMKINLEDLRYRLQTIESQNIKLALQVQKLKRKEVKDKDCKDKQNEKCALRIIKKKVEEDYPKTARGRSNTMIRDKSKTKLRDDCGMIENIDFNNHNIVSKIIKRGKNMSKSKAIR